MRGHSFSVRIEESALRILDERARRADESVARAAGRVVAGVLGLAFKMQNCGRYSGHYKPASICWKRRRDSPRNAYVFVSVTAPMRNALDVAARANGCSATSMFAQMLHGALMVRYRPLPRGPEKLYTPEELRRRVNERSNRYYWANREKCLRSQKERIRNMTEEQRAHLRDYQREWAARKRDAERASRTRLARPAGW